MRVADEVAGARHDLGAVSSPACSNPAASLGVTACRVADHQQRRDGQARLRRAAAARRGEACAGRRGRAGSWRRRGRARAVARRTPRRRAAGTPSRRMNQAARRALSRCISPAANSSRVPGAPGLERELRRHLEPGVRASRPRAAAAPARVAGRQQQAREAAPVVADDVDLLEPERVEQRDQVADEHLRLDRAGRRVGPAEAAQVGHDQPPLAGSSATSPRHSYQCCGQPWTSSSGAPVAGLGDVHAQPAGVDEAVLDALDVGEVAVMRRRACGPSARPSRPSTAAR